MAREPRILAATRLHIGDMSKPPDMAKLRAFVDRCGGVDGVAVAVGAPGGPADEELDRVASLAREARACLAGATVATEVIPVSPWGTFLPALNALTAQAARGGYDYVLFASVETTPSGPVVRALARELSADASVLVAGAALPGHAFAPGDCKLTGVTTPWNTLALWRVEVLALVGFPLVGEGVHAETAGGVEEVSAITAIRRIAPSCGRALVVKIPGVEWATIFDDPKRAQWQAAKMASKVDRAARHLALLGADGADVPTVTHVAASSF